MKRNCLLAVAALLSLHTGESRSSESEAGASHAVQSESEIFTMDRIYPSMFGPSDTARLTLLQTGEPEVLWITAVRSDVVGGDGETPESTEYFCHSVVARHGNPQPDRLRRLRQLGLSVQNRKLFTLVQGLNEIRFPRGFGIPVFSDDQFDIVAMAMNPSEPEQPVRVGIDSRIEYARASELDREMKPLFVVPLVLKAPRGGADADHSVHQHGGDETCLDVDPAASGVKSVDPISHVDTAHTGHWYVPPGRHTYRYRLGSLRNQIPFDTKVHYIASHLHPFGESLELIDVTTGETVFEATAHNFPDRVAIEEITHYSSQEGLPIDRSHEHELVAIYNNTTDHDIDSMAVMYLYLRDSLGSEHATGFLGSNENIHCVEDVAILGVRGESLCLAHKTTGRHVVAGIYLSDDGYVLGIKADGSGDPDGYYRLTDQQIAEYQAEGSLPSPLPEYSIPIADYLRGYSLWIMLGIAIVSGVSLSSFPARMRHREASRESAA